MKNWTNLVGFTDQSNRFFPLLTFLQFSFLVYIILFFYLCKSYHHHHHYHQQQQEQRFTYSHTRAYIRWIGKLLKFEIVPIETWHAFDIFVHLTYCNRIVVSSSRKLALFSPRSTFLSSLPINFPSRYPVLPFETVYIEDAHDAVSLIFVFYRMIPPPEDSQPAANHTLQFFFWSQTLQLRGKY